MKIWKRLQPEYIFLNARLPDKDAVLHFATDVFVHNGVVKDADMLYGGMKMREDVMSTGIGNGIGIPHAPSPEAKDAGILLIRLADPIDFQALDALPVDVVLAMVVPTDETSLHLQLLAGISRLCHNPQFMRAIREARDPASLREGIKGLEEQMAFH